MKKKFFSHKKTLSPPINRAKNNKPDILVKRSNYSKAVRGMVLADAVARQKLIEMGGENTIDIIREFDKDMSDEELSRKTGIKASEVRVVLNRLHNRGLFSYTRVRDRDSGWYSYIWKMSEERLRDFSPIGGAREVGERSTQSDVEAYYCSLCSPQNVVGFEEASNSQFRCPSCGNGLVFLEKKK